MKTYGWRAAVLYSDGEEYSSDGEEEYSSDGEDIYSGYG